MQAHDKLAALVELTLYKVSAIKYLREYKTLKHTQFMNCLS